MSDDITIPEILTDAQKRRAEALRFVKAWFPNLGHYESKNLAQWIVRGTS